MSDRTDFDEWQRAVDAALRQRFGIGIEECAHDQLRTSWELGESPADFATWFGEKYDLTPLDDPWL